MERRINLFILLFLSNSSLLFAQSKNNNVDLFESTIQMINKYSNDKGEYNGKECDSISKNVHYLIYEVSDSIIDIERKIDLLSLMIYFQRYSTNSYRAYIADSIKKLEWKSCKEALYFIPLICCDYCKYEFYSKLKDSDIECIQTEIRKLNVPYSTYYDQLYHYISTESSSVRECSSLAFERILKKTLINNIEFQKKYSMFKWTVK